MSGVIIVKGRTHTIVCADQIALSGEGLQQTRARTHKIFHIMPGVYAAGVGVWPVYTRALQDWAAALPDLVGRTHDPVALAQPLSGPLAAGRQAGIDARLFLVFAGDYVAATDRSDGDAQSVVVFDPPNFTPVVTTGVVSLPQPWLTKMFSAVWDLEETMQVRVRGAIATSQFVEAFMTMCAMVSPFLDPGLDTLIVGSGAAHNMFRGGILSPPFDYIL